MPFSLRTGIKGNNGAFKRRSLQLRSKRGGQCYFKRSLSHEKPFISRHPIGSLNASVSGLIVSVYTSIGEPALPLLHIRRCSINSLIFGKHPKVISHQPHIAFKKKKEGYRESPPDFNFLSYLISTANIQLLYAIIAILDVKYP